MKMLTSSQLPTDLLYGNLSEKLLEWYDQNHRCLPWRVSPMERASGVKPNPYHVFLSEIMLQQTTVATVKGYFSKFITLWPDIAALSAASLEDVLKHWAGLGYYSRARNLKATADRIATVNGGMVPNQYEELRFLPGIGDYTAAAIMAIAYDEPYVVIDGNVERIMARLMALDVPKPVAKKHIKRQLAALVPSLRPGDFAQAMMDLGSMICRPSQPICPSCPWCDACQASRRGETEKFPLKSSKKPKPLRTGIAFVICSRQGRILLQKRKSKGLLAQMSEVPNHFGENISKSALEYAPCQGDWHYQGEIAHIFTHFRLEMSVYLLRNVEETIRNKVCNDGWWVEQENLDGEALPSVMRKILALALPAAFNK